MIRTRIIMATLGLLLALSFTGAILTRKKAVSSVQRQQEPSLITESLLPTAQRLAPLADSAGEQELAKQQLQLADQELDLTFDTELRAATERSTPADPKVKALQERVAQLKQRIATRQQQAKEDPGDELAKARLALAENELEDAQGDLARQDGDRQSRLTRLLREHEATEHRGQELKAASPLETSALGPQLLAWRALRERLALVLEAQRESDLHAARLEKDHVALEGKQPLSTGDEELAEIAQLADRHKTLSEYDKRITDSRRISKLYGNWAVLIEARLQDVYHLLLVSFSWILTIALAINLAGLAVRRALKKHPDRRRRLQLQTVTMLGLQVSGLLLALLVIFGPPSQLSTFIGFATAGVTLVMKDFIMAFFGWFALLGKDGIHIGDWVEIDGVGGEVIEMDMLRTVLLEMGNWADRGHPTGRRVSFMNSFAFGSHYFNFSTSDQWLWDELTVSLPSEGDPYHTARRILETVQNETDADSQLAEQDWQRMTRRYGTRAFSAKPAVDIRPASTGIGLDVHVRYITRAPRRYEVKSRLFERIVEVLQRGVQLPAKDASVGSPVALLKSM